MTLIRSMQTIRVFEAIQSLIAIGVDLTNAERKTLIISLRSSQQIKSTDDADNTIITDMLRPTPDKFNDHTLLLYCRPGPALFTVRLMVTAACTD